MLSWRKFRDRAEERANDGRGFPPKLTDTARTYSGHSVLGVAPLGQDCSPVHVVGDSGHGYHGEKNGYSGVLRRFAPGIPMTEAAQPGV
jgi:hypothetical protein